MSENGTYFRTGQGSHRHASRNCANVRRSIHTGDVVEIPAEQVGDWEPCVYCCDADTLMDAAKAQITKTAADPRCTGTVAVSGSYNPRRVKITGTCATCGRANVGMDRRSMKLAKHLPA